jgi:hypothetical protein
VEKHHQKKDETDQRVRVEHILPICITDPLTREYKYLPPT